jgi:hypothetical protein
MAKYATLAEALKHKEFESNKEFDTSDTVARMGLLLAWARKDYPGESMSKLEMCKALQVSFTDPDVGMPKIWDTGSYNVRSWVEKNVGLQVECVNNGTSKTFRIFKDAEAQYLWNQRLSTKLTQTYLHKFEDTATKADPSLWSDRGRAQHSQHLEGVNMLKETSVVVGLLNEGHKDKDKK